MMHSPTKIANLIPIWQLPHLEDPNQTIPITYDTDQWMRDYPPIHEQDFTRHEWYKGINQLQNNSEQGILSIYRSLELATRKGFPRSIAMAELALGYYEGQRGLTRPARRHLLNALAEIRLDDFAIHEGINFYYLGWVCCLENAYCEALTYLHQSLILSYDTHSTLLEASSHFQLAYIYGREKKAEQAFKHSVKSLNLFVTLDHPLGILATYDQQATLLEEASQLEEAERILKLALAQACLHGTTDQQVQLLQKYSFLKYQQTNLSESAQALGILMVQPNLSEGFTLENYELARKLQAALGKKQFEKLAMLYAELPLVDFLQTLSH